MKLLASRRFRPFVAAMVMSICMLVLLSAGSAVAQSSVRPPADAVGAGGPEFTAPLGDLSDSDIWRYFKHGAAGAQHGFEQVPLPRQPGHPGTILDEFLSEVTSGPSTATSTSGPARTMQVLGEEWRLVRRDIVLKYSPWILLAAISVVALFGIVRGRIRIRGGRSGKMIPRFSLSHRVAHWFLATSFILMAISGLLILLGRPLLVPLIGKEANAVLTSAALQGHNLFGPVFILALLLVIVRFMRGNFFQWADLKWIIKGGGLLGGHASSNFYNFGEKTWYWIVVIVGLIMSASGLFLLFPWLSDVLAWHQLATVAHAAGAVVLISIALGHIYVGSIGMEGSIDSMLRGEVDENWAKEHHDLWYEKVTGNTADVPEDDGTGAKPATEGQA